MATYRKLLKNRNGDIIIPVTDLMGDYSTTELFTGCHWIDGRKIYKKTINFGSLPNNNTKRVNLSISNLKKIVKIDQHVTNGSDDSALVLMSSTVTNTGFNLYILNQQICVGTNSDRSSISAHFTVYYTKTTD